MSYKYYNIKVIFIQSIVYQLINTANINMFFGFGGKKDKKVFNNVFVLLIGYISA
ncbi:hypothetical protein HDF22_000947 [Mucilaginibacter lappiensis]|uniref:Uncharacterized protein n=1 Tax=Mucilaginibacter lappiensis TaxID=354630 RepID=A0A841J913_9SPHI|nr:hypothetical protein [Mucilaginibacter lappiensis]